MTYISLLVYWWIHLLIFYLELLHVYSRMRLAYNFSFFWCPWQALDSRLCWPNEMNWKVLPPFIFSRISDRLVSGAIQWWSHVGFLCVKVLIMDLISFINIEHSDFLFILLSVWGSSVFLELCLFHIHLSICFHEVVLNILFYHLNLCRIFKDAFLSILNIYLCLFSFSLLVSPGIINFIWYFQGLKPQI